MQGWFENIDGAGAETELAAIVDNRGIIPVGTTADHLRLSSAFRTLIGVYANIPTTTTSRVRLKSAGLDALFGTDQAFLPYINGGTADVELGSPQAYNDLRMCPWTLPSNDELRALHVANPAAAADTSLIGIWSDGGIPSPVPPQGGFWARATTTAAALTAGAWGNRTIAFTTALDPGWSYDLLAGRVIGDTLIAAGAVGANGEGYRMPLHVCDSPADLPAAPFAQPGQFGVLHRFDPQAPFSIDLLANDADNQAQDCLFYVRKASRKA